MSAAPDFVEPVLGYRAWHLGHDGLLRPWTFRQEAWVPGVNTARCARDRRHRPPVGDCMCGLYALTDPADRRLHLRGDQAVGAIAAWGELEVHRTGFRAEHACVVALALPTGVSDEQHDRLAHAAAAHMVALVAPERLSAEARRHGAPLDLDLLPPAWPSRPPDGAPPAVDPGAFAGPARGIALDAHLWVETALGAIVVGATRALAARAMGRADRRTRRAHAAPRDAAAPHDSAALHGAAAPHDGAAPPDGPLPLALPAPGTLLAAGDHVTTLGGCGVFAPVAGRVLAVNPRLAVDPGLLARDPEGAGWLMRLAPTAWDAEASAITWGRAAGRHYAAALARDAARGDALADVRVERLQALPPVRSGADVLAALRAARAAPRFADASAVGLELGGRLRDALAADPALRATLGRLGATVAFALDAPAAGLVLDLRGDARVRTGDPEGADVVLACSADDAYRWFTGALDPATALRTGDLRCPDGPGAALRALAILKHLRIAGWTPPAPWGAGRG